MINLHRNLRKAPIAISAMVAFVFFGRYFLMLVRIVALVGERLIRGGIHP